MTPDPCSHISRAADGSCFKCGNVDWHMRADALTEYLNHARQQLRDQAASVPMRIICPECKALHVDEGEWATRVHHTHSCQNCGLTWRPAVVATVGVQFLPGFKNEAKP